MCSLSLSCRHGHSMLAEAGGFPALQGCTMLERGRRMANQVHGRWWLNGWKFKAYKGRQDSVSVVRVNARRLVVIPAIWVLSWTRLIGSQVLQARSTMNRVKVSPSGSPSRTSGVNITMGMKLGLGDWYANLATSDFPAAILIGRKENPCFGSNSATCLLVSVRLARKRNEGFG